MVTVFWGYGSTGRKAVNFCKSFGQKIDYIYDRKIDRPSDACGIPFISIEDLKELSARKEVTIFITCDAISEVTKMVNEWHLNCNVIPYNDIEYWFDYNKYAIPKQESSVNDDKKDILIIFALNNGLALGGVERWACDEGDFLKTKGKDILLLLGNGKHEIDSDIPTMPIETLDDFYTLIKKTEGYKEIFFIMNFTYGISGIGHVLKNTLGERVRIVQVVHNDEDNYYTYYTNVSNESEACFSISKRITERLITAGYPKEKIRSLNWRISTDFYYPDKVNMSDDIINIGYAGRINAGQKRIDLLEKVIQLVLRKTDRAAFNIAGDGEYLERLKVNLSAFIDEGKLTIQGNIPHEKMNDFWKKQEIYISCSDHEGHSISQCEAILAGAVPVATDVSGVRDDVEDGVTGFLAPCGDFKLIATRVLQIVEDYELLNALRKNGQEKAYKKYCSDKMDEFCDYVNGF